jgi:hypothetical protein
MPKKHMTVVFEYEEDAKLPKDLLIAFGSNDMIYHDTVITAISIKDQVSSVKKPK